MVGAWCKAWLVGFLSIATLLYYASLYEPVQRRARLEFLSKIPENLSKKPAIDIGTCNCSSRGIIDPSHAAFYAGATADANHRKAALGRRENSNVVRPTLIGPTSACSAEANSRGPGQQVVSFSLYGTLTDDYEAGIRRNAERVKTLYPGWIMRVYHSLDTNDPKQRDALCDIWCRYPHVDFCSVGKLPLLDAALEDVWTSNGMIWRFLVLGDPLVRRFIIRDLDSEISEREVRAVSEWIESNFTWHFMHDNPAHYAPILGGMWGGMNRDLGLTLRIRDLLIYGGKISYAKGADQILLAKYLFQVATRSNDYIDHSSYLCNLFMRSTPFPTRRATNNDFVGSIGSQENESFYNLQPCPEQCRPPEHLDWIFC